MDTSKQKVAILIPTLGRPHRIAPVIDNIREVTPELHEIYFMTSDKDSIKIIKDKGAVHIPDVGNTDLITRTNALFKATTEPFVYTGSDDVFFHNGWLTELLKHTDKYSVLVPNDLLNPNGTQALISREYVNNYSCCIDTPEVIYYPGYKHAYADNEQFETAQYRGVFKKVDTSIVEHLHPDAEKSEVDSTYQEAWSKSNDGLKMYLSRKHLWGR